MAQTVADFENFGLQAGQFLNNADAEFFTSGNVLLPNDYDQEGGFWQGWAISADTNTTMPGFLNQYSAITGGGAEGSLTYAISYAFNPQNILLANEAVGAPVAGLYLTNTTYAYLGMRDGIGPAKAFGGPTGDDPDFLLLTIHGFRNGELTPDSVDFYLGDYRFANNDEDYLVDEWTWVDLTGLGNVDSLRFRITGSDVGEFGLNTPAYVCLDQIVTSDMPVSAQELLAEPSFRFWPNPAMDWLMVDWASAEDASMELLNAHGQVLRKWPLKHGQNTLPLTNLAAGSYYLRIPTAGQTMLQPLLKF